MATADADAEATRRTTQTMNDLLRRAAGRSPSEREEVEEREPVGDVGIGRGGAAAPHTPKPTNDQINAAIRLAGHRATRRIDLDGVDLTQVFGG
jgi:hypothetical protein